MKITIIGAGIAGLTTAIALKKAGIDYIIYESAATLGPVGAGLGLGANAIKAFGELGIEREVMAAGRLLESFAIKDEKGNIISRTNSIELSKQYGTDNFTIHRYNLHEVLLKHAGEENVVCGKRCVDFKRGENNITLFFDDNTKVTAENLIVSDGINSPLRKKLLPGSLPRYSGYTCWRGVVDDFGFELKEACEIWGTKGRFGIVPLANNKTYWFACVNASEKNQSLKSYTTNDLYKHFSAYPAIVKDLIRQTDNSKLIWADICDLKPLSRFAFGNILLIGDAAHATTPNMGQGACQAIEDAVVLGNLLSVNKDVAAAFKLFENRRVTRTTMIVNKSWQIGKMAQLENKVVVGLRNFLLKRMPPSFSKKQMKFLYEVDFY